MYFAGRGPHSVQGVYERRSSFASFLKQNLAEIMYYHSVERLKNEYGVSLKARGACALRAEGDSYMDTYMRVDDYDPNVTVRSEYYKYDQLRSSLNDIFRKYTDGKDLWPENEADAGDDFTQYADEYCDSMYGIWNGRIPDKYIALSPYDPRFSGRKVFREFGVDLLYLNTDTLPVYNGANGQPAGWNMTNIFLEKNSDSQALTIPVYHEDNDGNIKPLRMNDNGIWKDETLLMDDDINGLSRLRPYMSDLDYLKVRSNITASHVVDPQNPDIVMYASERDLTVAEQLLQYLQDNGYTYSVEPDLRPGQMKAKVKGTNIDVRIMDVAHPEYVGRVYDNGAQIYVGYRTKYNAANKSSEKYIPTSSDCLAVLKYALGQNVSNAYISPDTGLSAYESYANPGDFDTFGLDADTTFQTDNGPVNAKKLFVHQLNRVASGQSALTARESAHNRQVADNRAQGRIRDYTSVIESQRMAFRKIARGAAMKNGKPYAQSVNNAVYHTDNKAFTLRRFDYKKNGANFDKNEVGIYADGENRSANAINFHGNTENADKFLKTAFDSACMNFRSEIDLQTVWDVSQARIAAAKEQGLDSAADLMTPPEFSRTDANIAALQLGYYNYFIGLTDKLILPSVRDTTLEDGTVDGYEEGDYDDNYEKSIEDAVGESDVSNTVEIDGDVEDRLAFARQHLDTVIEAYVGHYDIEKNDRKFSAGMVAHYMKGVTGIARNTDNIVSAMDCLGLTGDDLLEDGVSAKVKDKLLKFDKDSATAQMFMCDDDNPFVKEMYESVLSAIHDNGGAVVRVDNNGNRVTGRDKDGKLRGKPDVRIDDNGVIQYRAIRCNRQKGDNTTIVTGYIGQMFVPDALRCDSITTKFSGSKNYMFVPGYEGYIKPQVPGEMLSCEERMRFKGYKQKMHDKILYTIRNDWLTRVTDTNNVLGTTTSLNGVYRGLYDTKHPVDYFEQTARQGMTDEYREALLRDEANHVNFSKDFVSESAINKMYHSGDNVRKVENDWNQDPWGVTDGHNMAVVSYTKKDADGNDVIVPSKIFADLVAGGKAQLSRRTFMVGTTVDKYGVAHADPNSSGLSPLLEFSAKQEGSFTLLCPADRQTMSNSVATHELRHTRDIHICCTTVGGWNVEDGTPNSKEMADEYTVVCRDPSLGDDMRSLVVGDKTERIGNKGVINQVIDRGMSIEEAGKRGMKDIVQLFKDNPQLDMVYAPFSFVSRFNGGFGREPMYEKAGSNDTRDLVLRDENGQPYTVKGGMGTITVAVAEQTVDNKSHVYDVNGRAISAQNLWAFDVKHADNLTRYFYRNNLAAFKDTRELMMIMGIDMSETGKMQLGYHQHIGEDRRLYDLPDYVDFSITQKGRLSADRGIRDAVDQFSVDVSRSAGFMELPFNLSMPGNPIVKEQTVDKNGNLVERVTGGLPVIVHDGDKKTVCSSDGHGYYHHDDKDKVTYALPVLSSHLRCGQTLVDGTVITHDYTNQYLNIYRAAVEYKTMQAVGCCLRGDAKGAGMTDEEVRAFNMGLTSDTRRQLIIETAQRMRDAEAKAQASYESMSNDIRERNFDDKHNVFRSKIMSVRTSYSATSVVTGDPRVSLDSIAMNSEMAKHLCVKGAYCLPKCASEEDKNAMWVLANRAPDLRASSHRYLKVVVDDTIPGQSVALNPVGVIKGMDGDFDGDTLGLNRISDKLAQKDAYEAFSYKANLIDRGCVDSKGRHPLAINDGLDIKVALFMDADGDMAGKFDKITQKINDAENAYEERYKASKGESYDETERDGVIGAGDEELWKVREECFHEVNALVKESLDKAFGKATISFNDPYTHLASIKHACIDTGAKGSPSKFNDYAKWYGVKIKNPPADNPNYTVFDEIQRLDKYYDVKTCSYDTERMRVDNVEVNLEDVIYLDEHGTRCNPLITPDMNVNTQIATDIKTEGTGTAGRFSNIAVAALRNICPECATELTYPVTQAILQAKHDPIDAMEKYGILTDAARALWQGYSMTIDKETNKWKVRTNEKGRKCKATPDEWVKTFCLMYTGSYTDKNGITVTTDDLGNGEGDVRSVPSLNVNIDPKHVEKIAKYMTMFDDNGNSVIMNVEKDAMENYATPIDYAGYAPSGSGFEAVCRLAARGRGLYDGFERIAPDVIRDNIRYEQRGEFEKIKAVVAKDVVTGYDDRLKVIDEIGVAKPVANKQNTVLKDMRKSATPEKPSINQKADVDSVVDSTVIYDGDDTDLPFD